jgi:cardiolipin synthase (CMP-forming)
VKPPWPVPPAWAGELIAYGSLVTRSRAGGYDDGDDAYDESYGYRYPSPDDDATIDVRSLGGGGYEEYDDGYGGADYDDTEYADEYQAEYDDEYEAEYEPGYENGDETELTEDGLPVSNRIFTVPNLISMARLAGVPLFLALILSPYYGGPKYDVQALVILALSGFSDWLDGKLARRWNQMSRFGAMIDPLADRLYILATLVGLTMRHIIPLWLPAVLIGRDLAMLVFITPRLRKAGYGVALPVHFLGKAATFNLLYAFPLLLLGQLGEKHSHLTDIGNIFGWAFVGWGTALYLLAGGMYFVQARQVTRGTGR